MHYAIFFGCAASIIRGRVLPRNINPCVSFVSILKRRFPRSKKREHKAITSMQMQFERGIIVELLPFQCFFSHFHFHTHSTCINCCSHAFLIMRWCRPQKSHDEFSVCVYHENARQISRERERIFSSFLLLEAPKS